MTYQKPKPSHHPLIDSGPLSSLYKNLIKCKECSRIVDFRTKVADNKEAISRLEVLGKANTWVKDVNAEIIDTWSSSRSAWWK